MKKFGFAIVLGLLSLASSRILAVYEQEQMQIESQLQSRIEGILSKTLPPSSYLVTVKAEMENRTRPGVQTPAKRGGTKSLLGQNQYILPGVPGKKEFVNAPEPANETTGDTFSAETLVKRIIITILVAPDVTADKIRNIREVITGSVPFNPLRGDEMDIQNSSLLKPATPVATAGSSAARPAASNGTSFWGSLSDRANGPALVLVGGVGVVLIFFLGFLFGPMRAFLNRLLTVLPRVGEQAAYTVSNAPAKTAANGTTAANSFGYGMNGNGPHHPEEEGARPFRFIREDQLNKLPILFKSLSPAQCALVLAYLPAEWASKVLSALDQGIQTTIMRELSQAREVLPDVVKELEEHIKAKLPYLVGGTEWIQSVYQLTQPQTQRALLGTLNQQSPELAQALRRKTFFLEDLGLITTGALRMVIQEAGYPTVASALRDEKPEITTVLLNRLPVTMREILQQELEMAGEDKAAILDAKMKLMNIGRRFLIEGRIALPEKR